MTKSTLYTTAKVLPGNKIEIQNPNLSVGQTVEVVILVSEVTPSSMIEEQTLSLEQRQNFLKLPISERRRILESQAEELVSHYQQDSEWQDCLI